MGRWVWCQRPGIDDWIPGLLYDGLLWVFGDVEPAYNVVRDDVVIGRDIPEQEAS